MSQFRRAKSARPTGLPASTTGLDSNSSDAPAADVDTTYMRIGMRVGADIAARYCADVTGRPELVDQVARLMISDGDEPR